MSARDVIAEIKIGAKLKVGLAPIEVSVPLGTFNAEVILAALDAAGLVVVPKDPTRKMLNAAIDTDSFKLGDISPLGFRCTPQQMFSKAYTAMLKASEGV